MSASPTPSQPLRLAVSGTYSSGKTTATEVLSIATGIPRTDALTARQILVDLVPEKQFQQLSARELLMLGLRRFEERVNGEAALAAGPDGSFISDGSVLHEWIYGQVRMEIGINPGAPLFHRALKRVAGLPAKRFYQQYMDAYGVVAKHRAKRTYDSFVHLPVEFEMAKDGHRPVSEKYRHEADRLLISTLEELEIPYTVVRGSVHERVAQMIELYSLPQVVSLDDAVAEAEERIARSKDAVAQKLIENQSPTSLRAKVKYAVTY
jgi:hypothetical protein